MVARRRSGTAEHRGVTLRAAATQRQQQRVAAARQRRRDAAAATGDGDMGLPGVYRDMLIEAGVPSPAARRRGVQPTIDLIGESGEPPVKRIKRPGQKSDLPMRGDRSAQKSVADVVVFADKEEEEDEEDEEDAEDADDDVEFEDIVIPEPVIQTRELDSEDEEDDDDDDDEEDEEDEESSQPFVLEDVVSATTTPIQPGSGPPNQTNATTDTLELNLTEHESVLTAPTRWNGRWGARAAPASRKKPLSRAERMHRIEIHKMHLLCLLAHAAQRNRWCNSAKVQKALRPLLTAKMISYLNPDGHLSQFGQTESLKNGLQQVATMFKTRFRITERGMRRALWAESPEQLKDYELPKDAETVFDKDDFIAAAKSMQGSRDVGAQLFCALLRAAGVETRLVCSLQPLSFLSNAPTMPKPKPKPSKPTPARNDHPIPSIYRSPPSATQATRGDSESEAMFLSPRRRLGHPDAAAYNVPAVPSAPPKQSTSAASSSRHVVRGESAFPVYWVEVLDAAHQKWQPVDPLVTCSQWKVAKLEPPAADKNNQLSYAIGFAAEGDAKDVTRRYAKAYNAKTKRTRIDGLVEPAPTIAASKAAASSAGAPPTSSPRTSSPTNLSGAKWLRRALRYFRVSALTDVDQIEDIELNAAESREPMPRNVADFQNHPVYALVRHLRRHEVLVPNATAVGTVAAGAKAPLERIYRRRDVRIAYSADRWYRLGRVVLPNEIPAKWLPKPRKRGVFDDEGNDGGGVSGHKSQSDGVDDDDDDDDDNLFGDSAVGGIGQSRSQPSPLGIPIFTPEQTELYRAPPVVDGRIPKNKFGNIELYVPSMVPEGGEHIDDPAAGRAAYMLGVDYAPALSGFNFQGRKGTAVLRGAVVATEHAEAVRAVLEGLKDLAVEAVAERRTRAALRAWTFFLRGLRIRQRIRNAAEDRGELVDGDGQERDEESDNDAVVDHEDENQGGLDSDEDDAVDDARSDVTEEFDMVVDDDGEGEFAGGGGFINDDDYGGGGFIPE
ncbi:xeroderma pigmentosum group C-complementing protein [Sporothrix brasiliensis 5110]|uniref:Xeroderma pigmentosum group C-complementing protein n=1 Tax=Sporothrix brasiliensis 5110 TaxID=1398154 RepID=A0A0C2IQD9_9PEZI|nr:xeroderma pigmentosum group C-complementing protein [Sporothrix brasiliensis 5110]KIH91251.1 xeroderma pigmentosum group C-complementing protein [Sporothrix brasiliensis 5110]